MKIGYKKSLRPENSIGIRILIIVALSFIWGCGNSEAKSDVQKETLIRKLRILTPREEVQAPEFKLTSLTGQTVTLSNYKGKLIFLNFSTSW